MIDLGRRALGVFEGQGRRVALGVLLVFVIAQVVLPSLFDAPRQALFDAYQNAMPRQREAATSPVTIVAIDDASLNVEGQWPWPRDRLAKLVTAILAQDPAALGIDMVLPRTDGQAASASARVSASGPDDRLAAAVGGGPVVLGVVGVTAATCDSNGDEPGPFTPFLMTAPPPRLTSLPCYAGAIRSSAAIDLAAAGHGLISNDADRDGVFRRMQLVSRVGGQLAPSFGLDVYRLAMRYPVLSLRGTAHDVRAVDVGGSVFHIDREGGARINYTDRAWWSLCSAEALLQGKPCVDPTSHRPISLKGSVVLLGLEASGLTDQLRKTPVGAMPGVEIHAQGLENLFAGRFVRRPWWTATLEPAMTVVIGLFLILVLPRSRGVPRWVAGLAPLGVLVAFGVAGWREPRWLIDVATPAIGCGFVLVGLLAGGLADVDAQRRRLRRELEIGRLNAARAEGELEAGRRIQMGILPSPRDLKPDPRFDLDAVMTPARQIGGDLYDFFLIDRDHLFIAVGDVSGKGLPASLFMALGKALCKSCALRGESDVGAIVRSANAEISRDNPEMLFITLFAGILDLRTGELRFCNAGHDAPFLVRSGAAPSDLESIGGPPLCVLDGFDYQTEVRALEPGDLLCITTDGVTEAMTRDGALMGRDEVTRLLSDMTPGVGAREVIQHLQSEVARFVDGADPSDDLTILTIRWHGAEASEP